MGTIKIFNEHDYEESDLHITMAAFTHAGLNCTIKVRSTYNTGEDMVNEEWTMDVGGHREIGEQNPTFWNGKSYVPEKQGLKILFISQTDTYIIAEAFHFKKQDKI